MRSRFLLVASVVMVAACDQRDTPCEQAADEVRALLEDCGVTFVHYDDDLGEECTPPVKAFDECLLRCYRNGTCEDYLSELELPVDAPFHTCKWDCPSP